MAMTLEAKQPDETGSDVILDEAAHILSLRHGRQLEEIYIERVIVGVFCTGVKLSNGYAGIAYTPPETIQRAGVNILKGSVRIIRGMQVGAAIAGSLPGLFARVIRLAAINALSAPFLIPGCYAIGSSDNLTEFPQLLHNKRICMVGAIIPLLKQLKELGLDKVTVIDKKEATQAESDFGHFIPLSETAAALSRCDTAIFTGASIANGTIISLINSVPKEAAIIVLGPTAGFIPEPLFRRNVSLIGTVVVTESDGALDILAEGGGAHQLFHTCLHKISLINPGRMPEWFRASGSTIA